jgi:flagellar hook-associated protein 3 FlgL
MTSTGRLGSLSLLTDTLRDVSASQVRLSDLQNQISSGFKSRDFEGLNGNVEQFTQLNGQLSRATQFKASNRVNIAKLETADAALSTITEIADKIKNVIVGANGGNIGSSNIPQVISDLLASLGGELNATFNGNYIFGGSDTVNLPVPDTGVTNTALGLPDDNYYAGSKQDVMLRADDRTDVVFPVRADDIAFQKIYAAAKQAIKAAENSDTTLMGKAQTLIISGQSDLIAVRSRVGSTVVNIQTIDDRLSSLTTYWKGLADAVSKTDIVAASTEVSGYQAILQASFQVYARLSQLRLSDYLK